MIALEPETFSINATNEQLGKKECFQVKLGRDPLNDSRLRFTRVAKKLFMGEIKGRQNFVCLATFSQLTVAFLRLRLLLSYCSFGDQSEVLLPALGHHVDLKVDLTSGLSGFLSISRLDFRRSFMFDLPDILLSRPGIAPRLLHSRVQVADLYLHFIFIAEYFPISSICKLEDFIASSIIFKKSCLSSRLIYKKPSQTELWSTLRRRHLRTANRQIT